MRHKVSFFAVGVPAPKGSLKAFRHNGTGRVVTTNDNAKTKPWQTVVAWSARVALEGRFFRGAVAVTLEFVLPRPRSHFGTGRNTASLKGDAPTWPTTKPDVDKLTRACLDALTGIAWVDDAQVARVDAVKHYQAPGDWRAWRAQPGCLVTIAELHTEALGAEVASR